MNNKPSHLVSFSRIVGTDANGKSILESAREIGAIWPHKGGKGSILRFDHIPEELIQNQGVVFVTVSN